MQTCTCEIMLGGNVKSTTLLQNVTPAEVQILRRVHGPNSVIFRGERDEIKRGTAKEVERLTEKYRTSDPNLMGAKIPVFSTVFPGASPVLPLRFSEIGFGAAEVEQRVLPDKSGFHGDAGDAASKSEEEDDWEEEEESPPTTETAEPEEPAAPKRKPGRPKRSAAPE
jgi:hypothetical protein